MPDRTQKQIAAKYKDNLTYYKQGGAMRRVRFWLSVLAVIGGLAWAIGFQHFGGSPEFFNTGPISQNHARFKHDCTVCHEGATTDLFTMLPGSKTKSASAHGSMPLTDSMKSAGHRLWEKVGTATDSLVDASSAKLEEAAHDILSKMNLGNIDNACLKCHDGMSLHQPGVNAVLFRETTRDLSVVKAEACSTCHKEHVGEARMKLPTSETCVDCHSDTHKLKASLKRAPYNGSQISVSESQNRKMGDLIQWLPATEANKPAAVIHSFTEGHPAFLYESRGAMDKAAIKFNHARHFASDIPDFQGHKLSCADCHQPDANGVGMQRISFAKNCQSCHSLGIDPKLPGFDLPHREPEHVRAFLGNLNDKWNQWAEHNIKGLDAASRAAFVQERAGELLQRWPRSLDESVKKAFFIGDPPATGNDTGQTLPACAKCHEVEKTMPVPSIKPTLMPDQWLSRGPFKHASHTHMSCADCHGAAEKSRDTADILMPSQKLCAECHRERDYTQVQFDPTVKIAPTFGKSSPEAAAKQRKEGGVFADCLSCHKYHVPAAEMEIAKSLAKPDAATEKKETTKP